MDASPYELMMAGLSRLRLYEIDQVRAHLDSGIELLEVALSDPPLDTPRLGLAGACLADAYRQRAVLDEDLAQLELSTNTGERAIGWSSDGDPVTWRMAHQNQAVVYAGRWRMIGNRADLDRAIASWLEVRRAFADGTMDAWQASDFGDLLRDRAELDGDSEAAAEAVALLQWAVDAAPHGHDAWLRWYGLGRAYHAQWILGHVPGSLEQAARCLDRASLLEAPDDDDLLSLHSELLDVGGSALIRDRDLSPIETRASAARYVQVLARGRAALTRAVSAEPDLRSRFALSLAWAEMGFDDQDYSEFDQARVRGLLDLAAQRPCSPPGWTGRVDLCNGVWAALTAGADPDARADGGVAYLALALAEGLDDETRERVRQILPIAAHLRGQRRGDLRLRGAAEDMLRDDLPLPGAGSGSPESDSQILADVLGAMGRGLGRDLEAFIDLSQAGSLAAIQVPPDREDGPVASLIRSMRQLAAAISGAPVGARPETSRPMPASGAHIEDAGLSNRLVEALSHAVSAVVRNDFDSALSAVAKFEALVERTSDGSVLRLGAAGALGQVYLEIARRDAGSRTTAHESARWFAEAARLARGPEQPQWPAIALGLAEASRRAGNADPASSRALGLSALAAHGLRVILQAGTDYAIEAARIASADATLVAGWCWEDHAHDELLAALDASRGLVLWAATLSRQVPDRLIELGHDELAAEWRATGGLGRDQLSGRVLGDRASQHEIPNDLRMRVLAALNDASAGLGVAETVRATDIGEDLTALGADALVYLVAAAPTHPGLAVCVSARGEVDVVVLPGLKVDPSGPVRRYARVGVRSREVAPAGAPKDHEGWEQRLADLCQWAWRSAMGELVDYVRQRRLDRPTRMVLVPMGVLALVPWHAAYTMDGLTRRYAVADIAFSYIPSARMLGEAARHLLGPIRSVLVVGNPDGDLAFAGIEAQAVRTAFYPHGTYLGRPPENASGAGTPDEVRAWVAAAPGPSMLHFACHAHADLTHPSGAHLSLAGGTLSATDLVDATRLSRMTIERVFLAACTTNTGGEDYDEAFSLATAFLAAGAHTVFGSLWPVPDLQTSLLMFMVHHYLNIGTLAPLDALHAAQRWMIDPDRQPPTEMHADLAAHARRSELSDPVAWAAFTHLGR